MSHVLTAVFACVYAELVGYLLHRLLHSGWVPWLTRRHLVHHLDLYGPSMKLRTPVYRDRERGGIAGVGWEWIVPSLVLFVLELALLHAADVSAAKQAIILVGGLLWSVVFFYRAHEAMHVSRSSWLLASPLRGWFLRARRLHDIHHVAIDEHGRFTCNFGVTFHGFDRLFGSYRSKVPSRPRPQL
jgi:hypothetical protein